MPGVNGLLMPLELERWYYADLDRTQKILEAQIRAAEADGDRTSALANRCLLAEALVFHHAPGAKAWIANMAEGASPEQRSLYTAWSQYYTGRLYEADRKWDLADSMLGLVLAPPEERLGPDLYLRAKIMQVRLVGNRSKLTQADSLAMALRPLVDANGSPRRLAELLQAQGSAHLVGGDPESAEQIYTAALEAAMIDGDPDVEGLCLLGVANAQIDQGRAEQCATTTVKAEEAFARVGDLRNRVSCLKLMGFCYWDVLGPQEVLDRWLPAIQIADSLNMPRASAIIRLQLAKFRVSLDSAGSLEVGFRYADRFSSAYRLINEAEKVALEEDDPELLALVVNTRAAVLNWEGRFDEAINEMHKALLKFQAAGNAQFAVTSMIGIASNEISRQRWRAAIDWLEKALPQAEKGNYNKLRLLSLNRLSFAHEKLGRYAEALDYKDRWYNLKDSLEGLQVTEKIAQTELRHTFAKQQFADSLMHAQVLAQEREAAQTSVQRLRLRSFGLAGGGLLLAVGGTAAYVLDRKRRRERYAKQAAQLETKALRSQMNPHFIFNALNSISAFIRQQEPEKAHDFVARFGRLMRLVLENSRKAEVPLVRDLEALGIYLELEQARSGDMFDFLITIDPAIDQEELLVPPLVLQPFVENAVWHGMFGKEGRGKVEIDIRMRGGGLVTTISDDGIGMPKDRAASTGGRSLGTVITKERLDQLAEQKGRPAGFRYLECPKGTCVEVEVPI
ncbi:MAG: histidine kinase [Flavobacteriales bacterium]|jgi:two-component sensor histidine kinase|nr:histidine kinase [Flavobacteriales bacterium]